MRTHRFTSVTIPEARLGVEYFDVSTVGTGLDGMVQDAPLVVNMTDDQGYSSSGDGILTVRASAVDTLRFRIRGNPAARVTDLVVTEL